MDIKNTFPQVQDSIKTNNTPDKQLKIERKQITTVELRSLAVDSTRFVKPKKHIRIIKTIPYIPLNDSIAQPVYDVFENCFFFPSDHKLFDNFNFIPLNPKTKNDLLLKTSNTAIKIKTNHTKAKTTIIKNADTNAIKGFISTDWMLGIIIFSLILFGWIRVGFSRFYQNAVQASYNFFTARRIFEESNIVRKRVFYFMNFLFYVNISLFLTQILEFNHIKIFNLHGILLFISIMLSIMIVYLLKTIVFYIFEFILLAKKGFLKYLFTILLYNKVLGIALLPIISVIPFVDVSIVPILIYIGVAMIFLFYIFRILRGLQIGFNIRLSILYLILYLCALEIIPVLILIKIVYELIEFSV
jgi:hypothetical protein